MAKVIHLLYYFILMLTVLFVVYLTIVLALSPKTDEQKRGFIPCTAEFVKNVTTCGRGEMICPLSYIWQDTLCNTRVILKGFGAWIKGKQATPWNNYLFTPIVSEITDSSDYDGDIAADMRELEAQSQLSHYTVDELTELYDLNLLPNMYTSAAEETLKKDQQNTPTQIDNNQEQELGNIADEAFIEEIKEEDKQNDE